jgi:hypothetical protein
VFPPGLAARGKRLWSEVLDARPGMGAAERILLEEACRLVDRLEALDRQLHGEALATVEAGDGSEFTLVVNGAMSEARLAGVALRGMFASLGLDKMPAVKEPAAPATGSGKKGDPIDDITARRQQRAAGGAGT